MQKILTTAFATISLGFFACQPAGNNETGTDSTINVSRSQLLDKERETVKKEPVDVYDVPLKDDLNHWRFTVKLKETKARFSFLLDMKYQEMTAADTIDFPNFGLEPQPRLRKGKNDLECIVGFLDKEQKFRDYLKVFIDNDQLRVKQVKQYAVYGK